MKTISKHIFYIALSILSLFLSRRARAEDDYNIGNTTLKEIWVDPAYGKDGPGRGTTRATALKSVRYAWNLIPQNAPLTNEGFLIYLAPGTYRSDDVPTQFQSVWGTAEFPVIFQAADDTGAGSYTDRHSAASGNVIPRRRARC